MKNKFTLKYYIRQKKFTEFLAFHRLSRESLQDLRLWAHFKLGMYSSVVQKECDLKNWRILFAKTISHAALGNHKEASKLLKELESCKGYYKYMSILISGLAPYMHKEALSLEKNHKKAPSLVGIALLLKLEENDKALQLISENLKNRSYVKKPEYLLFYANAKDDLLAKSRLTLLNRFLLNYGLQKLKLKDLFGQFNIHNIESRKHGCCLKKYLVSVIVTTYNSSFTVKTALNSLLQQSYENIEIIVIDDASNDETVSIIQGFINIDDRIKLIKLSKNVGTYVAKNIALEYAKGEFVTCHDSDDFSHASKIELQVLPLLKDKKLIATISNWVRIDNNGKFYTRHLFPLTRLNLSSLMFRKKEVCEKIGVYDTVRTGADSEFFARINLVFGRKRVKKINKPLSFGAHRENSLMTASSTGYNESGISFDRLEYWEAWNYWHAHELTFKRTPSISLRDKMRKFDVPENIVVTHKDIMLALKSNEKKNFEK